MILSLTSNINLKSEYGLMKYLIQYNDSLDYIDSENLKLTLNRQKNSFSFEIINLNEYSVESMIKHESYWDKNNEYPLIENNYIPKKVNIAKIQLYFPNFSVDSYVRGVKYILTLSTWISGHLIYLGTYLINRNDSLAAAPILHKLEDTYMEYIEMPIIDPYDMIYSDDWAEFRQKICGESENINNTGAVITATLCPVMSAMAKDAYIILDGYSCSWNGINLFKYSDTDFLNLNLQFKEFDNKYPYFKATIRYNLVYENLLEYLKETYNMVELYNISYKFIIGNELDIYNIIKKDFDSTNLIESVDFYKYDNWIDKETKQEYKLIFDNWNGWQEGIYIKVFLSIFGEIGENSDNIEDYTKFSIIDGQGAPDNLIDIIDGQGAPDNLIDIIDGNIIDDIYKYNELVIPSNQIPFSKDIMKYFIDDKEDTLINLNDINMNVIKIDAVNKVVNKIIQMDRAEDTKSNISYPVFYRAYDTQSINIDPGANENICINLDRYKSKVNRFKIQFKDNTSETPKVATFLETGRVSQGVIFKIIGNLLPQNIKEGTYRILDENDNKITLGNYKYIQ